MMCQHDLAGSANLSSGGGGFCAEAVAPKRTAEAAIGLVEVKGGESVRLDHERDVHLKTIAELKSGPELMISDVYFECGNVMRCYAGRFRFTLSESEPIEIVAGEAIIVYPDQRVTIEALDAENVILYAMLGGRDAAAYLTRFGFYDGMHGVTSTQETVFRKIQSLLRSDNTSCIAFYMEEALVTYAHDLREGGNALVCDAVRQIGLNLEAGIVRLQPLCEQLKVSRPYLSRAFAAAGLATPAAYIRGEQLRLAKKLLRETRLPIAEVARKSGFISIPHFSNFIRRMTSKTAGKIRLEH